MSGLSLQQTKRLFIRVADDIIANQEVLTEADRAIGDSDHGVGMARGFEAVRGELANSTANDLGELLRSIGTKLMMSIGGAAGAIYGTFFRSAGRDLAGVQVLDSGALYLMLSDGMAGVQERGKAQVGDKTIDRAGNGQHVSIGGDIPGHFYQGSGRAGWIKDVGTGHAGRVRNCLTSQIGIRLDRHRNGQGGRGVAACQFGYCPHQRA